MRWTRVFAAALLAVMVACASGKQAQPPNAKQLVFLTRDGCVDSKVMADNLTTALRAVGGTLNYDTVDLDRLPQDDPRRGYPTPTVLVGNKDLFGMTEPMPPVSVPYLTYLHGRSSVLG